MARDEGVVLLDLSQKNFDEFNKYSSTQAIFQAFGYDDYTHFTPQGAKVVGSWVKELICEKDESLCSQFK